MGKAPESHTAWTQCATCGLEVSCYYITLNKIKLARRLADMHHDYYPRGKHCENQRKFKIKFFDNPEIEFDYFGQDDPLIEWLKT